MTLIVVVDHCSNNLYRLYKIIHSKFETRRELQLWTIKPAEVVFKIFRHYILFLKKLKHLKL